MTSFLASNQRSQFAFFTDLVRVGLGLFLSGCLSAFNFALGEESKKKSDAADNKPSLKLDTLKRDDFVTTRCGCAYYAPTNKREDGPMYLWIDQSARAILKINGQPRDLKLVSEERVRVNSKKDEAKVGAGDKLMMVFKGETASASINQTAERNCRVGQDCSTVRWQATINLSEFEGRKSMKTWAVCGCPGRQIFKAEEAVQSASTQ